MATAFLAVALLLVGTGCGGGGGGGGALTAIRDYTKGTSVTVHSCHGYDGTLLDSRGKIAYAGENYKCSVGTTGKGTTTRYYYWGWWAYGCCVVYELTLPDSGSTGGTTANAAPVFKAFDHNLKTMFTDVYGDTKAYGGGLVCHRSSSKDVCTAPAGGHCDLTIKTDVTYDISCRKSDGTEKAHYSDLTASEVVIILNNALGVPPG